jgi:hypothetical protein
MANQFDMYALIPGFETENKKYVLTVNKKGKPV